MNLAIRLARLLLAAIFLYAGAVKLGISERFAITIAQFFILPLAWPGPFAASLPWIEMLAGILLLIPRTARVGAFAAAVLLVAFIGALGWAWSQGFTVDCGCFGSTEDEPATATGNQIPYALARDVVLLALTLPVAAQRLR